MKYHSLLAMLLIPLSLMSNDSSALLSPEKRTLLGQQQEINQAEHEKLRTKWISPINLNASYSYDKSAMGDYHSDTENLSASISQDIFRSGGITYQIRYADAKKQSSGIAYQQSVAQLNQQLFLALLTYQKNSVLVEQSQKRLNTKEIEIFIKRQLFESGKVDVTELNNALMEKSSELKTLTSLKYSHSEQRYEIAKISDINPDIFSLPHFELVDKEQFVTQQFDLQYAQAQSDTLKNLYHVTASQYLPAVVFNADIGYRNYNPKELGGSYNGDYYSAGLQLTMPLVYNASATIQEAQATYLQESAKIADHKRALQAEYAKAIEKIQSYRDYIAITSKNLILYDELIRALQAGVTAGTKTGYDLQTLQNTKAIEELEIKINEINIQIELAKLHFALQSSKEPK